MNDNVRIYHIDEYCEGASHFSFSERKDVVLLDDYKALKTENEQLKKDIEHVRSFNHTIKMRNRNQQAENERLKAEKEELKDSCSYQVYGDMCKEREKLRNENEKLKGELKQTEAQDQVVIDGLREKNAKLIYALARLRWEHAHDMETMIDQLYTERPSSWRFYHKSKTYWFRRCQKLKKELKGTK